MTNKNKIILVSIILIIVIAFFFRGQIKSFLNKGKAGETPAISSGGDNETTRPFEISPDSQRITEEELAGTMTFGKKGCRTCV